jgi:hypothetical protein
MFTLKQGVAFEERRVRCEKAPRHFAGVFDPSLPEFRHLEQEILDRFL